MWKFIRREAGTRLETLASAARPLVAGWRWIGAALTVGSVPAAISLATGWPGHQIVAAILLAWLLWPCVASDDEHRGLGLLTVAFGAHCVFVLMAASAWPERAAAVLPGAEAYWQKQHLWITTGEDPEYAFWSWFSRHVLLVFFAALWAWLSLGVQLLHRGFMEVDLMNYYVARLMSGSDDRLAALVWGWHVWSLVRGLGFLWLTFEMASLAWAWWTGRPLSTWPSRRRRWLIALGLLILDGVLKHTCLELVRQRLAEGLVGG